MMVPEAGEREKRLSLLRWLTRFGDRIVPHAFMHPSTYASGYFVRTQSRASRIVRLRVPSMGS